MIAVVVVLVVILSIMVIIAALAALLLRYRKRKEKKRKDTVHPQPHAQRESVFDNPVYDVLNKQTSISSSGYATVAQPHLEPTASLPRSNVASAVGNGGYSELTMNRLPPPRSHSSSPHSSPPPFSSSPLPLLHQYHTLQKPEQPTDYLEPSDREESAMADAKGVNIYSTLEGEPSNHDYHELDPTAGVSLAVCVWPAVYGQQIAMRVLVLPPPTVGIFQVVQGRDLCPNRGNSLSPLLYLSPSMF